jgi:signal transduction histidine kinase
MKDKAKNKRDRFKDVLRRIYTSGSADRYDMESERKVVLLNIILTLGFIFEAPYIFITYVQGDYWISFLDLTFTIFFIFMFFYLQRTRDPALPGYLLTIFASAFLLYLFTTGGANNLGSLWSYGFPTVVMFLLGTKKGTIALSIYLTFVLLILFIPGTPLLFINYSIDYKIGYITGFIAVSSASFFVEWVRARTHKKITGKTIELEKALTDLKKTEAERVRLQDKLVVAKKMEAIGTLAGGMAHEFNNLVAIIEGFADLLLEDYKDNKHSKKMLGSIRTAANRISVLTNQLLSFSRKQILQMKTVNINHLINQAKYTIEQVLGDGIQLVIVLGPNPGEIQVDPGQITQVIMDMVLNSRDAMPEGGKLTIKTENVSFEKDHSHAGLDKRKGRFICLSIEDTGIGMDKQTTQKIFEPFFTTKEVGKGTGLGLSFAYGTVKQHNGWVEVSSEPGEGTILKVYLPTFQKPGKPGDRQELLTRKGG